MSEAVAHGEAQPFATPALRTDLRAHINWICQTLRIAAALWITWGVVLAAINWSDKAQVLQNYGRAFSMDLSDVSAARYAAASALVVVSWATGAVVALCIWRLASTYLAGRVFTVDAAIWLRRTAIAGMFAVIVNVLGRVGAASILTGQLAPISPLGFYYILPQDLLHLIFAVFVFALGHIFKAAAEMAEDHAQIV